MMASLGSAFLRRSTIAFSIGVAIGVAIGGGALVYPGVHTFCAIGPAVGMTALATPLAVVNAPYEGASSLNLSGDGPTYSFGSGSLDVQSDPWIPSPGSDYPPTENGSEPWGLFMVINWTLYSVENETGISSFSGPCTQAYVAEAGMIPRAGLNYQTDLFRLGSPNVTTDFEEPTTIPGARSVQFFNGLNPGLENVTAQYGPTTYYPYWAGWDNCLVSPHSYLIIPSGTIRVPLTVPFTLENRTLDANGFLTWTGLNGEPAAVYIMPALQGLWTFASVGAPFPQPPSSQSVLPGGLYSFSYAPCPP
jgi:hypothetical protein